MRHYMIRTVGVIAAALLLAITSVAMASDQRGRGESVSRPPPPKVAPVTLNGLRFEQVMNGKAIGLRDVTGYLRAVDVATGETKWVKQVYSTTYVPEDENDAQAVYFATMRMDAGTIVIVN